MDLAFKVLVFGAGLFGQGLGVPDQSVGLILSKGHEVAPSDLEDVVDEPLFGEPIGDGQVAREDHAVKTRDHGDDQAGELGVETRQRFHGVLLQAGCLSNTILATEGCLCSYFLVAASPR